MKNTFEFQGMNFTEGTPEIVCELLVKYNKNNQRVRLFYGDATTGKDWIEENDTIGTVGKSCGNMKIPLLVKNSKSYGGGAILTDCIVKITVNKKTVYAHENYNQPETISENKQVFVGGKLYANMQNEKQAERLASFLLGERNCK